MARGRSPYRGRSLRPLRSCMKHGASAESIDSATVSAKSDYPVELKRVIFDEVKIRSYPTVLGDNPAVSSGAPLALGWKSNNEVVEDIDFFEYCRKSERKSRRKDLILSNRKRTTILLEEGYGIEEVLKASMACEMIKQSRADSLRAFGWNNPMELLSGAAETTGSAIKAIDILGVGTAAGAVVGAGAAVVNVGADVTIQTGRMLVNGVTTSTKVVTDGFTNVGGAVMSSVRKLSPKRS